MNIETIIIATLLFIISGTAASVVLYWHITTKGSWKRWPAGRSLMALLIIICIGHGWGAVNRLADYPLKQTILMGLYAVFALALVRIGITIHKEMATGRAKLHGKGPGEEVVALVIATNPEETPNGKL